MIRSREFSPRVLGRAAATALPLSLLLIFAACAGLGGLANVVRPEIRVVGAEVEDFGLDSAELLFEFEVDNPNGLALVLDQVGYRLALNGRHLLDGRRDERTEIAARGESLVRLPVTVRYEDLYRVIRSFSGSRRSRPDYELDADFQFDAPLVGGITVPVRKTGEIPIDRLLARLGR